MLHKLILSAALLTALTTASSAQELPKPGPHHDRLKEFVGTWDAVMDMNGQKSKAVSTYKSICDGMWVESDFQGDLGGVKFQGRGIDGYDLTKKKYVALWFDSMSSAPMQLEGNYDASGKTMVMTGESTGPDGKPQKVKTVTEAKDKDHFNFKMYMLEPNGDEQLAFTIDYTRRK
jgi:hypothetical protein